MFGLNDHNSLRFVYLTALLVMLVGSVGLGRNRRAAKFRHLGVWLLIAIALVVVYAYRGRVLEAAAPVIQELAPSRVAEATSPQGQQELVVRRSDDGHFHLDAMADGVPVRFLVDTGASTTVLTAADAARVGIDPSSLSYDRAVQTANGMAYYASASLSSLSIGPYHLASVPVGVMPAGKIDTSLLGMNTINRFSSWRVEGDKMMLVP